MSDRTPVMADAPAFHALCERFRALEARKAADEAIANFEQAQIIRDVRARLRVPIATICEALDLSAQSVNTYRNVAERIDEGLFRALVEERRPSGLPLFPWSTIVQVARLAERAERQALIEEIRLRGWRTRDAEGYVSVQRGDARARRGRRGIDGGDSRRVPFVPTCVDGGKGGGVLEEDPALGTRVLDRVASRMEGLVKGAVRKAPPARILAAVADGAARMITEASHEAAWGDATARELRAARDALARCAGAVADARDTIERRLAEAEPLQTGPAGQH